MSSEDSDNHRLTPEQDARLKEFYSRMFGSETLSITPSGKLPLQGVNQCESNAARRILQAFEHGDEAWYALSVLRSLEKPDHETPEITPELKKRLKRTIEDFQDQYNDVRHEAEDKRWDYNKAEDEANEEEAESSDEFTEDAEYNWQHWTPALMNYELYKGYAKNNAEMGELVFIHKSTKKFVLVNLCGAKTSETTKVVCVVKHYASSRITSLSSYWRRRLVSLAIPKVRATYTTTNCTELHSTLLKKLHFTEPAKNGKPPVLHLTRQELVPCFTRKDLSALDAFVSNCKFPLPGDVVKSRLLLEEGAQDPTQIKFKHLDLDLGKPPLRKKCDSCLRSFAPDRLKACGKCRSTLYCSQRCQKDDWKLHKMGLCYC